MQMLTVGYIAESSVLQLFKAHCMISANSRNVFLADDDDDDCVLFEDVLKELSLPYELTIANNGEQLMSKLKSNTSLPDLVFLDLNMRLKTGFECLKEIRS